MQRGRRDHRGEREGRKGLEVAAGNLCSLGLLRAPEQSSSTAAGLPMQFRGNPHAEIITAQGKQPERFSDIRQEEKVEEVSQTGWDRCFYLLANKLSGGCSRFCL